MVYEKDITVAPLFLNATLSTTGGYLEFPNKKVKVESVNGLRNQKC